MKCFVCEDPVTLSPGQRPMVFQNQELLETLGYVENQLVVCSKPRCVRLMMEVIAQEGFSPDRVG